MTTANAHFNRMRVWVDRRRSWLLGLLLLLAIVWPFTIGAIKPFYLSLTIDVLIFAIFAMSLNILLGYTGLPSFGHAAFFGIGGYVLAYYASRSDLALSLPPNLLLTVPLVMVASALVSVFIGFFALRTSGIYFLMITLAFAQMLFSIAIRWSGVTGGSDGLSGVARPTIGLGNLSYTFGTRTSFYFMVLAFFIASYWILQRIINSPFGWTLRGIRENEHRMRALGIPTFRYKMAAFAVAGMFGGVAGMLFTHLLRGASPDMLHWSTSGEVMVMLIIGGPGTISGPMLGAAVIRLFSLLVSSYAERWETLMGLLFIAFVLFAPHGIIGLLHKRQVEDE